MGACWMKFCTVPTSEYGHVWDETFFSRHKCQNELVADEKLYHLPHVNLLKCPMQIYNHDTFEFENMVTF